MTTSFHALSGNDDGGLNVLENMKVVLESIQSAEAQAASTFIDVAQVAADRIAINADMLSVAADLVATNQDTIDTTADATATAADRVQTGLDRVATAADKVATNADVVTTTADKATVAADKGIVAADKATVSTDKGIVAADKATVAANLVATNQDTIDTAADRVQTGLDVVSTAADKVATNADVVSTNSDVSASSTSATNALASENKSQKWAEELENVTVEVGKYSALHHSAKASADRVVVAADKATVSTDKGIVAADKATVAVDKGIVATDKAAVAADLVATNQDTIDTAANAVSTAADVSTTSGHVTSTASALASAEAARDATLAALDSFDDRYLGQKASDPTLDNDGNPLVAGALYFNTIDDVMKVYEGATWLAAYASLSGALLATNNLSDLLNASIARTNLGVAIGTNVQAYSAILAASTASFTTALKTKLDAIEAGSTGDQTGAEIKALYEAELNTNVLTDALLTKLNGIETGATADQTGAQIEALVSHDNLQGIPVNDHLDWTLDQGIKNIHSGNYTDTDTTYSVGDAGLTQKNFTTTLKTKLDGVSSGATVNQTDATLKARANHTGTQLLSTISDSGEMAAYNRASQVIAETGTDNTVGMTALRTAQAIAALASGGGAEIVDTQLFTASGTWTKPAGTSAGDTVVALVWGGGGSGARCLAAISSDRENFASGGTSGAFLGIAVDVTDLAATEAVGIGAGGAARTNESNGLVGGSSTFDIWTAEGGFGGIRLDNISTGELVPNRGSKTALKSGAAFRSNSFADSPLESTLYLSGSVADFTGASGFYAGGNGGSTGRKDSGGSETNLSLGLGGKSAYGGVGGTAVSSGAGNAGGARGGGGGGATFGSSSSGAGGTGYCAVVTFTGAGSIAAALASLGLSAEYTEVI